MAAPPPRPPAQSERERFERLWREHYASVLAFLLRRIDNRALAEEAAAETFLVAWRRREQLPAEPRVWLLGVARRVAANSRRGQQRSFALIARVQEHHPGIDPPAADPGPPDATRLAEAFNTLRPTDQEALALIVWDGLSPREAARTIGIPVARFSVRLHRAKQRLRQQLERPPTPAPEPQASNPALLESR